MARKVKSFKVLKGAIATTCVVAVTMSSTVNSLAQVNSTVNKNDSENKAKTVKNSELNIYPVPQTLDYISDLGIVLNGEVNVVVHGDQEDATITKLQEILNENSIPFTISQEIVEDKANLIITSNKEHCNDCTKASIEEIDALNKKEGYLLEITDDNNENGNISIVGADKDGAYYGVLTLGQILEQAAEGKKIAEVVVTDYPEIEFRGFIEGFYGYPWSHEDRKSLMKDTSEFKMNTYIYAPKDDPYHRKDWKELYPEKEATQIAELAQTGKENNFNFCWTIHPGATLQFTEADFDAVINKFEQLYDLGVRQFGVLFDDTDDWVNGKKQAEWINRIDREFVKAKGDVAPMIVISARYNSAWGPNMERYFKPFMQTLNEDIQVMWTGHATMSNVSKEVFEWPKQQTGVDKDVAVWWNYPVNDYCDSRILMAPLHNLNPDLDNVSGFFSNPMNQAEASKVALYSIADYTWNTDSFNYMESWETSIEKFVPQVKEEFMRFVANTCYLKDDGGASGPFEYDESWYLTDKIEAFKNARVANEPLTPAATELLKEFEIMLSDYHAITTKVTNENLLKELELFLGSYKALAEAGIASMKGVIAAEEGNIVNWMNENSMAKENIELMDTFKIARPEDEGGQTVIKEYIVSVGSKRIKPMVNEAIGAAEDIISKTLAGDIKAELLSNIKNVPEADIIVEEGKYSIKNLTNLTFNKGEYLGIALPKAMNVGGVELKANSYEGLEVQYSLNGLEWNTVESSIEEGILKVTKPSAATFVRILNTSNNSKTIDIEEFKVLPVYKAEPTIKENIGAYQDYTIDKALDGDLDTKYWSDKPSDAGHYIEVDLGNTIPLFDLKAYFGANDFMRHSEFAISEDGVNWTSLGELKYTSQDGKLVAIDNANGQMARYIRIQSNGHNYGCWVQLYEIEFNKTVDNSGDGIVDLVTGTPEGNTKALYDGNLSTAYNPESVSQGDELIYQMTRVTKVGKLTFLQDANNISDATISVKDTQGNWTEIGKLDEQFKELAVGKKIVEVKIAFDETKPTPKIYEIITTEDKSIPDEINGRVEKVSSFKAEEKTNNSVKLVWEAAKGGIPASEYVIYKDGVEVSTVNASEILEYTATQLDSNKLYNFKIVAKSADGKVGRPVAINVRTTK
ncbi:beta-N-acetylglucosaminidase domain-containing protein [Clostridium tarantellae]|uniref:Hyaluronidase n=1 Tax=Clostridium tarantellae TaxID=39493 RepID=A0A6I1MQN6_9CLOT|nr:beta-N-acetylglucosaminidase domain-containing protein [Clostridium tarantellae]MPQ44477.1 hyaluronidase [Clostridium tarantellae]